MQHTILNFINQHFFVGIDVHLRQWKVTIRSNGIDQLTLRRVSVTTNSKNIFGKVLLHFASGILFSLDHLILFFASRKCKRPPACPLF